MTEAIRLNHNDHPVGTKLLVVEKTRLNGRPDEVEILGWTNNKDYVKVSRLPCLQSEQWIKAVAFNSTYDIVSIVEKSNLDTMAADLVIGLAEDFMKLLRSNLKNSQK